MNFIIMRHVMGAVFITILHFHIYNDDATSLWEVWLCGHITQSFGTIPLRLHVSLSVECDYTPLLIFHELKCSQLLLSCWDSRNLWGCVYCGMMMKQ